MSTWKAVLAVVVIFVLGTVFGLAISYWVAPGIAERGMPARELLTQRLNQRLVRNLGLSPQQERAIAGIIEEARDQLIEVRQETRPRVRQVLADARTKIRAQLTPEQQARFDKNLERNRKRINRIITR